jgi:DNA polymerase III subunit beta
MKIAVLQENLVNGLTGIIRFTSTRTQLPILSHVLITADEGKIYLQATDLEKGMRVQVAGKVVEPGKSVVPAKTLHELLSTIRPGALELEASEQMARVSSEHMKAQLQVMEVDEFPVMQTDVKLGKLVGRFRLDQWRTGWERVGFALSKDEARPVLTGIYWEVEANQLVATDGFRLSLSGQLKAEQSGNASGTYLVRGDFWGEVVKQMGDYGEEAFDVYYLADSQEILVEAGELILSGRLIEGDYPNYQSIVPKTFAYQAVVAHELLARAVRAAAVFARDSAHIVRFEFEKNELTVSANAPQVGSNEVKIELAEGISGTIEIAFNARYLTDLTSHLIDDLITIGMNEPLTPACFWGKNKKTFRHVIMPVRVRD